MCPARPARGADTDGLAALVGRIGRALPDPGPIGVPDPADPLRAFRDRPFPFHRAVAAASELLGRTPYPDEPTFRTLLLRGRLTPGDLDAALRTQDESEGRADEPRLGGALSSRAVRRLSILHDIAPPPPQVLRWRLQEDALAARLPADVPRAAAARLVEAGRASLCALLTSGQVPALLAALSGEADEARAAAVIGPRLGVRVRAQALSRLLVRSPEAAVVSALWEACRRLAALAGEAGTGTPRDRALLASEDEICARVHPILARSCAAYFGPGAMADRALGLYRSARRALADADAAEPWLREAAAVFRSQAERGLDAAQALRETLAALGVPVAARGRFLRRAAQALPGWPGLIYRLARHPKELPAGGPPASLLDFLAVRLVLERAARAEAARRTPGPAGGGSDDDAALVRTYRLFRVLCLAGVPLAAVVRAGAADARAVLADLAQLDEPARRRVFQEACDHHHRAEIFGALAAHQLQAPVQAETRPPRFQILCCFDEREEPLRRTLEAQHPDIETLGVAGFAVRLRPQRRSPAPSQGRLSKDEQTQAQAQHVAALLEDAGLARGLAPIVAVLAHGATGPRRPPARACDACSATHARLVVELANRPAVREILRGRGIPLSDETLFVAAVRDPGTGAIALPDPALVPARHRAAVGELAAALAQARAHAPRLCSAPAAAVCIVGRRARTRGLRLDRRVRLVSYDPTTDPGGAILERVLVAAVPVGVRENLASCFAPGEDGPAAERPPPVRMLLVVEAAPAPLRVAIGRQPLLRALAENRWLWLASLHPETGALHLIDDLRCKTPE